MYNLDIWFCFFFFWNTVDQPQVKGPHMRFKKLVQLGKKHKIHQNTSIHFIIIIIS